MNNQFYFKNFEPDFQLRLQSNVVLSRILDTAPYGAVAVGLLEKRDEGDYYCALDVYSKQGPFMASAVRSDPESALSCLEEKIKKQIVWWKSHRGGGPVPPSIVTGHTADVVS